MTLRSTEDVDAYEIHYHSLDALRVAGWYCVPRASHLPPLLASQSRATTP